MKALVKMKKAYGHVELVEISEPTPSPTEVKVEMKYCGICGTDVKFWHDQHAFYRPPLILGHEFSAVVVEVGEQVSTIEVGDEVIALPSKFAGALNNQPRDSTRRGGPQLSQDGFQAEWGFTKYGAFTRYSVFDEQRVWKLPKEVDLESAAMIEPLAVAARCVLEKACVRCSDVVVVSGAGAIGILVSQIVKAQGGFVILLGLAVDEERLALAKKLGVDMVVNVEQTDPGPELLKLTHGLGADLVFECAGAASSVSKCIELVRHGGRYFQIGTSAAIMDINFALIAYKELTVTGSIGHTALSWERALQLVANGTVETKPLVSHKLPLSAWEEAFTLADEKKSVKILLYPEI